jgi:proton-translocating NAD(P)+ transhydrogenase subunit alpha
LKIAIAAESDKAEPRVAASPDSVKRFVKLGCEVAVETGAGLASNFSDDAFKEAGATIAKTPQAVLKGADVVLMVGRPVTAELKSMKKGAAVAAIMNPYGDRAGIDVLAKAGVIAFSMEFMPRITRAQSMDVLSSQSNLAGYKSVIDAVAEYGRALPMMMTAAGTVAPARVFVMGAGVAGLQAIATARRLGAIVSATDVRRVAGEQVESLGASFVMVEDEDGDSGETAGGYAKEMSEEYQKRQAELIAATIAKQDIVICTALIPGRPAPTLVTKAMVETMRPGSIIVDLAVERGGNCPLSKPGKLIEHKGVKIMGYLNVAGRLAGDASSLYARNLYNFIEIMVDKESKKLKIDWDDEIITGTALTRDGKVIHEALQ